MNKDYYNTKETAIEYIKLAEGYNGGELIDKLKNHLTVNSSLLEIGSGPGSDWKILNEKYNVTGSDSSNEFLDHLKNKYPYGEFIKLDAVSLLTNQKFDGLYSNKVLHHLNGTEIEKSIKRQHDVLNDDGIICHSFWKGTGSEVFKGLFVNYHDKLSLIELFKPFFEIILLEEYAEFEAKDSLVLIAKKI